MSTSAAKASTVSAAPPAPDPATTPPTLDLTDPGSLGRLGNYRQLAAAIGKNRSHVSRVMRGKTGMNTDVARKLAGELGITVDALIAHSDAMARVPVEEVCRCGHHVSAHKIPEGGRVRVAVGETDDGKMTFTAMSSGPCEACPCTRFEVAKRRGQSRKIEGAKATEAAERTEEL